MKKTVHVAFASLIIFFFLASMFPISVSQSAPEQAKVGIFYYVWYDTTNPTSWDRTIVDIPITGRYDSNNATIISQQLTSIEELGIDFVIVSWWGTEDDFGMFTDVAAKLVFETAQNINSNLKFAIMVEPFPVEDNAYNHQEIYDQIHNDFVGAYPSLYYNKDGKPLLCIYNDPGNNPGLTNNGDIPLDARFSTVIVGQQPYTQWLYMNLIDHATREGQVSVTPRYDESRLEGRSNTKVDPRLNQNIYNQEWKNAIQLWREGKVDTIVISTWNEYYERTAIEPHVDATAVNKDPYLLYTKTKNFINQLRHAQPLPTAEPTPSPEPITNSPNFQLGTTIPPTASQKPTIETAAIPEYPSVVTITVLVFILATASMLALKSRELKSKRKR